DGQLLGETLYDAQGQKQSAQLYLWLDSLPLGGLNLSYNADGAIASSTPFYLHADHLNTPRIATGHDQQIVWQWQSDAFGVGQATGKLAMNLRIPGQYFDPETGLHYNYFRDYDPETGRYVESDPIGLAGGLNTFGYVAGNPLLYSDPDGLIARYNGNNYHQWPTGEPGCEEPVWAGGYIVGWKPCGEEKKECPDGQDTDSVPPPAQPPIKPYQSPSIETPVYVPTPYTRPSTPLTRFSSCVAG